ncbi:MAG: bifunctional lysine ketoglutarate reductase /saccharopine dehydrogenase family protein [Bacteroidota bacterium]|nr:bifunctional lysine ketoglutarate reductase /saccharopine dehydrogenase family protein [Bacteroidota bacterium]
MKNVIGIRRETKDPTQQRVPLSPEQVGRLVREHGLRVLVQSMPKRIFPDEDYVAAGAELSEDLSPANIVFGVKEIDTRYMQPDMAYMFFSHTIKGQPYNMAMLRHMIDHGMTLFDYELIKNDSGQRLVFFGNFAGYAGMIDSMWAMGRRLESEGYDTPLRRIHYATQYGMLSDAETAFREVGERIRVDGLPADLLPFVCGFTGYGNVSRGAQHLYDLLPVEAIAAKDLADFYARGEFSDRVVYKVEFREEDMFAPRQGGADFILQEFYDHPERYESVFEQYLPFLSLMVNGIYWEPRYPRLVTIDAARRLWSAERPPRLRVIGDVTCDIDGSVQLTVKETNALNPVFVYEARSGAVRDGWEGEGPVILAVDKLPTELPREASAAFGTSLFPFVPHLAAVDLSRPFDALALPAALRDSIVAHKGQLTPAFAYLADHM